MSVPKGRRKQSRFEAQHHFYRLRQDVTDLILNDFGFSPEKYMKQMAKYRDSHINISNADEVLERWQHKSATFIRWFIDDEGKVILDLLRDIERNFTMGNSIYPSETPSKLFEFLERRKYINRAIGLCYTLKQEINYILRTLPVDFNKYERFDTSINEQIALYKGVRQSDNRLLKPKNGTLPGIMETKATNVYDILAAALRELGRAEAEIDD